MTIRRRLTNVERHLARGSGTWVPDMELLSHYLERQAAAAGKPLETFLTERQGVDLSSPERDSGETWHEYLARLAAMAGVSLAEVLAVISEWEERERAIIVLERAAGLSASSPLSHDSGQL